VWGTGRPTPPAATVEGSGLMRLHVSAWRSLEIFICWIFGALLDPGPGAQASASSVFSTHGVAETPLDSASCESRERVSYKLLGNSS
jgi:hypothetical protein